MKFLSTLVAAAATVSALTIDLNSDSAAKPDSKALDVETVRIQSMYNQYSTELAERWNASPHKFCVSNLRTLNERYGRYV